MDLNRLVGHVQWTINAFDQNQALVLPNAGTLITPGGVAPFLGVLEDDPAVPPPITHIALMAVVLDHNHAADSSFAIDRLNLIR
jgi:hypothetical protein